MRLRIGTLNVWGLPEPFSKDLDARMQALAGALPGLELDVLLIQEAWTAETREILIEGGSRAGFVHAFAPEKAPGGGLLVLSRLPLEDPHFERFRFRGDIERLSQGEYLGGKGFASVRVSTPEGFVRLIDTHLHAGYRRNRPLLNSAVRAAQLLQLAEHVRQVEDAVVAVGDLNCEAGDPEYRVWTGTTGMEDVAAQLGRREATMSRGNHYKRKRRGPDKRIDYAFVRRGRSVEVRPQSCELLFQTPMDLGRRVRPISDHYGLACEIEVGPGSGALTSLVPADPEAVDLAHRLLSEGRAELSRSESGHFKAAGSWLAGAAAAMVIRRNDRVSRRRFMHRALGFAAIAALAPAAGFTALAHLDVSKKLRAFDAAAESLGGMVGEHAPRPIRAARAEGTPDAGGASRPL